MEIDIVRSERYGIVRLVGPINGAGARELERALKGLTDSGCHNLVLNLYRTVSVSGKGIQVLDETRRICRRQGGDIRFCGVCPAIMLAVQFVGWHKLRITHATESEAMKALKA